MSASQHTKNRLADPRGTSLPVRMRSTSKNPGGKEIGNPSFKIVSIQHNKKSLAEHGRALRKSRYVKKQPAGPPQGATRDLFHDLSCPR
jgi:hypothetical protein